MFSCKMWCSVFDEFINFKTSQWNCYGNVFPSSCSATDILMLSARQQGSWQGDKADSVWGGTGSSNLLVFVSPLKSFVMFHHIISSFLSPLGPGRSALKLLVVDVIGRPCAPRRRAEYAVCAKPKESFPLSTSLFSISYGHASNKVLLQSRKVVC